MSVLGSFKVHCREGDRLLVTTAGGSLAWLEDADMKAGQKRLRHVDVVEKLCREGVAGPDERAAAAEFEEDYELAQIRPRYASLGDLMSPRGKVLKADSERQAHHRRNALERHQEACRVVGPYAASTLVALLCDAVKLSDYPKLEQVRRKAALLVGLQVLVGHYGVET